MKNLKELRKLHGLSQQKLANILLVSQQSIYKYENNLAEPDIDTLIKMSKLFNTSIDCIVGNDHTIKGNILTIEEQVLIASYQKLPPNVKTSINTLIQNINTKQ